MTACSFVTMFLMVAQSFLQLCLLQVHCGVFRDRYHCHLEENNGAEPAEDKKGNITHASSQFWNFLDAALVRIHLEVQKDGRTKEEQEAWLARYTHCSLLHHCMLTSIEGSSTKPFRTISRHTQVDPGQQQQHD